MTEKRKKRTRAYDGVPKLSLGMQRILFDGETFSRAELNVLFEIIMNIEGNVNPKKSIPFTLKETMYHQKEFYTAINKLKRKGFVKGFRDITDKRKKRYAIIPTDRNIEIISVLNAMLSTILGIYKEMYFDHFPHRTIETYSKNELIKGNIEMINKMGEELKYGYSKLDEVEFNIDKCVQTTYFKPISNPLRRS